jgi:hypothetical protein
MPLLHFRTVRDRNQKSCTSCHHRTVVSQDPLSSISVTLTLTHRSYDSKASRTPLHELPESEARTWMNRFQGYHSKPQLLNRVTTDGSMFTCNRPKCAFAVCTDCDRREHKGESCAEYLARSEPVEIPSRIDFHLETCPSCSATYTLEEGCGYTSCTNCRHRFRDRVSTYLTVAAFEDRSID